MYNETYLNADEAFKELYQHLNAQRNHNNGTRKVYNVGIMLLEPFNNHISVPERNWSLPYAKREWDWYLSQNRSVAEIKKFAPIWDKMHNGDNIVNSNYGYLWNQNGQLQNVIDILTHDPLSRQAWITIYDGKNRKEFEFDTPCTLAIGFAIENGLLCMSVTMRSNDLWYGFCNDQYCFSELQKVVAAKLKLNIGWYYHYAFDMHLYKQHFNMI